MSSKRLGCGFAVEKVDVLQFVIGAMAADKHGLCLSISFGLNAASTHSFRVHYL